MPLRAPLRSRARAGAAAPIRGAAASRALAGAAALAGASCLPDERPYWVIDHTDALAMRFEVIERGPWGADPPPGGGPVVEAMPGDRVRATPFVAGPEGPVDVAALQPRWFACGVPGCTGNQLVDLAEAPPCGPIALPLAETCALGPGPAATFELGPLLDVVGAASNGVIVMMVAGTPEGPSTRECLRRADALETVSSSLRDCLLFVRTLRVGPTWRTVVAGAAMGATSPVAPDDLPWQISQIEPDVAPKIAHFAAWVPAPGGGEYFLEAQSGATLSVRTGDQIALSLIEAAPPQDYYSVSIDEATLAVSVSQIVEVRGAAWFSTTPAPFELTAGPGYEVDWRAPEEPGTHHIYVVLADNRSAATAWLRVEVAAR
ncbi:hypothetical protein SAMN02745121_04730 [Nannocystis exedens]|uniref:Uncharacterized protein n=1 Tax=Nannocystis exedens TaxID=54 RepID=A0A1I2BN12_9BACT|nr:hypothetical protein [Nannocystis exedens]PCC67927.1 hypothetical protein NAEX_00935 [Nannocystis exedens]SFE56610.1 hypothetical protein SAMN02745121_04730 [Nannocystis exedens]